MHKLTREEIKAASARFEEERKAAFKAFKERAVRPPNAPGRFVYRPGTTARVEATMHDDTGRAWKGSGETMRRAYHAVVVQLEKAAATDPAANRVFDVIDEPPGRKPLKRDPQGRLL